MDKLDIKLWTLASKGQIVPDRSLLKTPEQIEMIKKSAELNTAVLDHVAAHIHAGMSTAEIDKLVYDFTTEHGGIPAPLNYEGFPKSVCTSINNVICHGIPSENEILIDGDIINVDVSTILNGYFSDASRMFTIGDVSPEAERIVRVTKECVELGLKAAKPWGHLGDIAYAINSHAQENGYSVVEEIGGHGIGLEFHEEPEVCHFGRKGTGRNGGNHRLQAYGFLLSGQHGKPRLFQKGKGQSERGRYGCRASPPEDSLRSEIP